MTDKKQQTIVVTGGAGFIGSHLCERLVKDGHKVISFDNYFTGSKDNHVEGVEYREGHTKDIATHIPETPDIIYHLGEYSRVHKSIEEPHVVWDMNILGTIGVLEYWRAKKCKLVYAASSTKFDATSKAADGTLGKDLAPYTWSKATSTDLVNNYGRWFGLSYAIMYFNNVYGPRERAWGSYGTVVATFCANRLEGRPHQVNAPGTQTRAFTHILDAIDAAVLVGENGEGDGYNISAQEVHSIQEIAELCGGPIVMNPQTKVSRSSVAPDTSQMEALGWKPQRTLQEYVESATKQ